MIGEFKRKLGECKRSHTSECLHKTSYIQISSEEFYVYDAKDEHPIRITDYHPFQLTVLNPKKSIINIIKTDYCLFRGDVSKCDCILFNDEKLFFVEIKGSSTGQRSARRREAVEQLQSTIELLINNGIDISKVQAEARICFRSNNILPTSASRNTKRDLFRIRYKVDLQEGNKIEF